MNGPSSRKSRRLFSSTQTPPARKRPDVGFHLSAALPTPSTVFRFGVSSRTPRVARLVAQKAREDVHGPRADVAAARRRGRADDARALADGVGLRDLRGDARVCGAPLGEERVDVRDARPGADALDAHAAAARDARLEPGEQIRLLVVARREVDVAALRRPRRVAQALGAEVRRQVDLAEARARAEARHGPVAVRRSGREVDTVPGVEAQQAVARAEEVVDEHDLGRALGERRVERRAVDAPERVAVRELARVVLHDAGDGEADDGEVGVRKRLVAEELRHDGVEGREARVLVAPLAHELPRRRRRRAARAVERAFRDLGPRHLVQLQARVRAADVADEQKVAGAPRRDARDALARRRREARGQEREQGDHRCTDHDFAGRRCTGHHRVGRRARTSLANGDNERVKSKRIHRAYRWTRRFCELHQLQACGNSAPAQA